VLFVVPGVGWGREEWKQLPSGEMQKSFWIFWPDRAVKGQEIFRGMTLVSESSPQKFSPTDQEAIRASEEVWCELIRRAGYPA